MPLTDTAIRQAKPTDNPFKLTHGGGMHLLIKPVGRYWRMDYRFANKRKTMALGGYPTISLKKARERREEVRRLLAEGIAPGEHRKANRAMIDSASDNSFEIVAREWFLQHSDGWAESHSNKIIRRMDRDISP